MKSACRGFDSVGVALREPSRQVWRSVTLLATLAIDSNGFVYSRRRRTAAQERSLSRSATV